MGRGKLRTRSKTTSRNPGKRAEKQGFDMALKQSFDPSAGEIDVFPQDIRRALLNVISNGFYAAAKRRAEIGGGDYEPVLAASTKTLAIVWKSGSATTALELCLRLGTRCSTRFSPPNRPERVPGLASSISHDIIVKQHAGSIEVDTQLGDFTEIRVILPRSAVFV
jgi:two-component system, NtrC family, sensor kinase